VRAATLALLRHAGAGGYAVPAFNVVDDLSLRAVVEAAEAADAPVIVQASVKTVRSIGLDLLTAMFDSATRDRDVCAALHLDHCPDVPVIEQVVAAGWSSVLFDASDRELPQAIAETRAVAELAHRAGVEVESEVENIVGVEDGVGSDVLLHAYTVEQLVEIAEQTGADLLAPQLGTAHGEYRGRPTMLPQRVRRLRALTGRPIVLHGGTGLTEAEFGAFIAAGVSKINISTALKQVYLRSSLEFLREAEGAGRWDPPSVFRHVSAAVGAMARGYFDLFGATGRATSLRAAP
jgi:ketose-bisphosphate aldolase